MNKWKTLAALFLFFSIAAIRETARILTSADKDIADNRTSLIPTAFILTAGFIFVTLYFWKKSKEKTL
ncbi:MAG TPA: hypothetical protein VKG26_05590 [Bacteroidia bacterium]|nr:hypothetical protein [Bacteroidia bacterium]